MASSVDSPIWRKAWRRNRDGSHNRQSLKYRRSYNQVVRLPTGYPFGCKTAPPRKASRQWIDRALWPKVGFRHSPNPPKWTNRRTDPQWRRFEPKRLWLLRKSAEGNGGATPPSPLVQE